MFTGLAQANFAFQDGSVKRDRRIHRATIGNTHYKLASLGVGNDASYINKDYFNEEPAAR